MAKESMRRLWDQAAPQYGQVGPPIFDFFASRLLERLQPQPGETILDVATGTGAVALLAAEKVAPGGWVTATDFSPVMLQQAKNKAQRTGRNNIYFLERDAARLQLPPDSFDIVTCAFSLYLFPQMEKCLREMYHVLRPGGRLGLTVWGRGAIVPLWPILGEMAKEHGLISPVNNPIAWNPADLQDLFSSLGYTAIDIIEERKDFWFQGPEEVWQFQSVLGPIAATLDQLSTGKRQEFVATYQSRIAELVTADGIRANCRVLLAMARK